MRTSLLFLVLAGLPPGMLSAQETASGPLAVYADLYQGRPTASGARYDRAAMTAAHATLPFGTRVRVANFESGRMADVVVNDRKKADRNLLVLSRAAADAIGLAPAKVAPGSLLVIAAPAPVAASVPPLPVSGAALPAPAASPPSVPAPAPPVLPAGSKPGFLASLFGKESAAVPAAGAPLQYGIPAGSYAPPAPKPKPVPGWFGQKSLPPAPSYPSTFPEAAPAARSGELLAMNAPSGGVPIPGPALGAPPVSPPAVAPVMPVSLPPASSAAPYRVQFGAFRRLSSADELAGMLRGAGIPSSVFAAPGSGLNVVVTDGGFRSAEEAQRWIDFEGARRGWTDRPVVIR